MRRTTAILLVVLLAGCGGGDGEGAETTTPEDGGTEATTAETTATTAAATTTEALRPTGDALVENGDRGIIVWSLQSLLACAGYGPIDVDGVFGPQTQGAVEAAQRAEGAQVTGAPDRESYAVLSRACDRTDPLLLMADGTAGEAFGNVAADDPDRFTVDLGAGDLISVTVEPPGVFGVSVAGPDGMVVAEGAAVTTLDAFAAVDGEHVIVVSTTGSAALYSLAALIVAGDDDDTTTTTDATATTVAPEALEPADWIGEQFQDIGQGLDAHASSAVCFEDRPECDYSLFVVGYPVDTGPLGEYPADTEVMAWLTLDVDGNDQGVVWEIVDADLLVIPEGATLLDMCFSDGTTDRQLIGIANLDDATLYQSIEGDAGSDSLLISDGTGVTCYDGAGDEIASG
jgi:peptidoglycan hydrolase-like protein with peptidoglycan-binding domain